MGADGVAPDRLAEGENLGDPQPHAHGPDEAPDVDSPRGASRGGRGWRGGPGSRGSGGGRARRGRRGAARGGGRGGAGGGAATRSNTRRDRSKARTADRPPIQARITPMIPSHSGPSCRVKASTQAEIPVMVIRDGVILVGASSTKIDPATQRQTPAAISIALGFATPFRNSTLGVTATA